MAPRDFERLVYQTERLFKKLQDAPLLRLEDSINDIPNSGVFVLYEDGTELYVGRSRYLRRLFKQYKCEHSSQLASRLAKQMVENNPNLVQRKIKGDSRFVPTFDHARYRITLMEARIVEVKNPALQAMLQTYAAFALKTPYNYFDVH